MAGTKIDPIKFKNLCAADNILPGDVFELQSGVYWGEYAIAFSGTPEAPIVILPGAGQTPIIDASLKITGSNLIIDGGLRGIIRNSLWVERQSKIAGSNPTDLPIDKVVDIRGAGVAFRNWILHDLAGFGIWSAAGNAAIENNVIFNIGWNGPAGDRGHGHLFYTQNVNGTKTITGNVAFNSFSTGMKIYTEQGTARGYEVIGNTIFNSAILHSNLPQDYGMNYWIQNPDSAPGESYTFIRNRDYHTNASGDPVWIGLYTYAYGVTLTDNYFQSGIIKNCEVLDESGNYYADAYDDVDLVEGTNWYGDAGFTIPRAAGNAVFVEKNTSIDTAGIITVFNEDEADNVTVDLAGITGLAAGDTVRLWNVQAGVDADGIKQDVQYLTVGTEGITIDMRAATHAAVAAPYQWDAPASTFPLFGCFVIEKE